jgi:serine/threonine protein kinase
MPSRCVRLHGPPSQFFVAPTVLPDGGVADGKYQVQRFVGTIGTRALYEVRPVAGERKLALHLLERSDRALALESELAVASMVRSENIVGVVDEGLLDEDEPYVVTAWPGEATLAGLLRAGCRVAPRRIARIACDILSGLADLHDAGFAHGDLSPTRICLSAGPAGTRAQLADRGRFSMAPEETSPFEGLAYQAPELARGAAAGPRSDVFSVGALLFRTVSGWLPAAHNGAPPSGAPPLDPPFARIVSRALAVDVDQRYPSATAMLDALSGWHASVEQVDELLAAFLDPKEEPIKRLPPHPAPKSGSFPAAVGRLRGF